MPHRVSAGGGEAELLSAILAACSPGGDRVVVLTAGEYVLSQPIRLGSDHSGLTLRGAGVVEITGGPALTPLENIDADGRRVWTFPYSGSDVRSLSVNHTLRPPARYPDVGTIPLREVPGIPPRIDERQDWEQFFAGQREVVVDAQNLAGLDLTHAELVVAHYWVQERLPISHSDPITGRLVLARQSALALWDDHEGLADCWIDFVVTSSPAPGHWSHDPTAGALYYAPLPHEVLGEATVRIPRTDALLVVGDQSTGMTATDIAIENIAFNSAGGGLPPVQGELAEELYWAYPEVGSYPGPELGASMQAAVHVRGAIRVTCAERIVLKGLTIEACEGAGVEIGAGSHDITIRDLTARHLGGGAITASGRRLATARDKTVSELSITGCRVHDTGKTYLDSVGILIGHVSDCVVADNELSDMPYSAISAGFTWGDLPTGTHNLTIENNRIRRVGSGVLSDLGGIYVVGSVTGGVVRGNSIVDVRRRRYGAWGIYLDEGTRGLVVERNVVARCEAQAFHHHHGRDNILRRNVFVGGPEGVIRCPRVSDGISFSATENVLVALNGPIFVGGRAVEDGGAGSLADTQVESGRNALVSDNARDWVAGNGHFVDEKWVWTGMIGLEEWRTGGHDCDSTVILETNDLGDAISRALQSLRLNNDQQLRSLLEWAAVQGS